MVDVMAGRAYLVDFGIAEKYMMYKGTHKEAGAGAMVGTPAFASLNIHGGCQAARRDDMESLAYVLARVVLGAEGLALPWEYCEAATATGRPKAKRKRSRGGAIAESAVDLRSGGLSSQASSEDDLVDPKQEFCATAATSVGGSKSKKGKKKKKDGMDFTLASIGEGTGHAVCQLLVARARWRDRSRRTKRRDRCCSDWERRQRP